MKYSGTLLPQTNEPVEIKKSVLDLLKKINEVETIASNKNPVFDSAVIAGVNYADVRNETHDPTGFIENNQMSVSYDKTTRILSLGGDVHAYWRGKVVPEFVAGWKSRPAPLAPTAPLFIYYDGMSVVWSYTPWTLDMLQIAYLYYRADGTFLFSLKECHGLMPWQCHEEFHQTTGTYRVSGGLITGLVPGSNTAADRRPAISACVLKDEDLYTTNSAVAAANYTHAFMSGTAITSNWNNTDIVPLSGAQPYWNSLSLGVWGQTLMTNNSYMTLWQVGFPVATDADSQRYKSFWLQGQSEGTLASQQALSPYNLEIGSLISIAPEFVFLSKVIIRYTAGDWSITEYKYLTGSKYTQVSMIVP